jgi:hypothetical protein
MSNFLWADKTDDHRKHWISWKQISSPKTEGGLDVRTFKMYLIQDEDGLETAPFKESLDSILKKQISQKQASGGIENSSTIGRGRKAVVRVRTSNGLSFRKPLR